MTLSTGTRLGPYEITSPLGAGGMGEVYRARDSKLGRDIAIKVLPEAFSRDPERLLRFEREARMLASLNHPNVAAIYGLEESDGTRFLVLELVPGETLAERIARGRLPPDEALPIFKQIAEGLEAAHQKEVVHRDLKPGNVNVTPAGAVKVLDFGLAKVFTEEPERSDLSQSPTATRGTADGVILGTAPYMSPEQVRGKAVDRRTDIWAFGCCLYEALAGRMAFAGETVSDTLARILEREPDWNALPRTTHPGIRSLLRRCLQKDRERRFRDMWDVRIEIEEVLAEPASTAEPAAKGTRQETRRRLVTLSLAGVLVAGLGAGLSYLLSSPAPRAAARFSVVLPLGIQLVEADALSGQYTVALSPDGKRLVFLGQVEGRDQLYLRSVDQYGVVPMAGTENARAPFFSPDGRWLGFHARGRLQKVPLDGGAAVAIADVPRTVLAASWGPDDTIVFASAGFGQGLMRVSASGGAPQVLTAVAAGEFGHVAPQILPDGKSVLFTVLTDITRPNARTALLSLSTGARRPVLEDAADATYLPTGHLVFPRSGGALWAVAFDPRQSKPSGSPIQVLAGISMPSSGLVSLALSPSGSLLYVPGNNDGTIVWVARDGQVKPMTETRGLYEHVCLSPDGRRVALDNGPAGARDVWVHDLEGSTRTRLTFDARNNGNTPIWSADGARVVFRSYPSGGPGIFWTPADGSGEVEPLVAGKKSVRSPRPGSWSPDGRVLAFTDFTPSTGADIWMFPLGGEPAPLLATPRNESWPMFSPDGRWLAYVSDESGRLEVYVRPYPGPGGKVTISTDGGGEPVWSRDGRELFYRRGITMFAVPVETRPMFKAGTPRKLFEARFNPGGASGHQHFDVSPDGRRFLMVRRDEDLVPPQLNVILNWSEELKARVPVAR